MSNPLRWEHPRNDRFLFPALCLLLVIDGWRVLFSIPVEATTLLPNIWCDGIIIAIAGGSLYALGHFCANPDRATNTLAFALGAICGCLFFARDLGFALTDPTAIGWLLSGDWGQHYSGWAMFRHTPWTWPLGSMPEVFYPVGTSIVYTDSLPLLALPLKFFSHWLPEPFQYIGIWLLMNCVLQGGFAALLVANVDRRVFSIAAGAMMFLMAPIFLRRLGHDTLMSQWVILASLWLYFRAGPGRTGGAWAWISLTGASALIHPYLTVMTLAVQFSSCYASVFVEKRVSAFQAFRVLLLSVATAAFLWWAAGAFIIPSKDGGGGVPYGQYTFNLLGFINPMGFSRFLPDLPTRPEQYEGFAYLGLGLFFLAVFALAGKKQRVAPESDGRSWWPLASVAIALLLFAASSVLTVGRWTVLNIPLESPLLGVLRASGRFAWIAYYVIVLWVIWAILTRYRNSLALCLILIALFIQIADFSIAHAVLGEVRLQANQIPQGTMLDDREWIDATSNRKHLTLLPPLACGLQPGPYLPFQLLAADHGMTINTGFLARWDKDATNRYCSALDQQMRSGAISPDDLYVVGAAWAAMFLDAAGSKIVCRRIDGYEVCAQR